MKILALEIEKPGATSEIFAAHLKDEADAVWHLYKKNIIREIYFNKENNTAVLIMECIDKYEAKKILNELPLVKENLIEFDIIQLTNYTGFERLF